MFVVFFLSVFLKITSSLRSLKKKTPKISNQLPSVNSCAAKGSILCRRLPDFKDQQASNSAFRSGSSLPSPALSPPPLLPSRISGKRNRNYKNTFEGEKKKKSQLQTRYATTLRHDKGGGGQKKDRKKCFKTTHFTLTPPKFSSFSISLSRHHINISIFSPPPPYHHHHRHHHHHRYHQHHHDHLPPKEPCSAPAERKSEKRGASLNT